MKTQLAVALMAILSAASIGAQAPAAGPSLTGAAAPAIVYSAIAATAQTATTGVVNVLTPSVTGVYRLTIEVHTTVAGSAGNVTAYCYSPPAANYTSNSVLEHGGTNGLAQLNSTTVAAQTSCQITAYATSGSVAFAYQALVASNTGGQFAVYALVERLL